MKWMKKTIICVLMMLMLVMNAAEVSAITTGNWDLGKARQSIGNAATQILGEEQETEAAEEIAERSAPEKPDPDFTWFSWMGRWFQWMEGWK